LQLASRGIHVRLMEMRPSTPTPVHVGGGLAELVCSNSLKTIKPGKPAGMLKAEMAALGSILLEAALECRVPAGGALAVDRAEFSRRIDACAASYPNIERIEGEALDICGTCVRYRDARGDERDIKYADAVIVATGPLTGDALAASVSKLTGSEHLAFFDAAAPIVMADSLNQDILFRQSRYGDSGEGDYLNAPLSKDEYAAFIEALVGAERVMARDFETKDLFSACQPIEEVARSGFDAPRHGMMKPVGLDDPRTGRRPWAAVQLRAEDAHGTCYNLVGFQTNLTFPEQARVFRMIPGLEDAEFVRYGVMHRNTFIDAPHLLDASLRLRDADAGIFFAGQVSVTEGYCEAIMSGLHAALCVYALLSSKPQPRVPADTAFGSLLAYATNPATSGYQPMHVNFGVFPPLEQPIRNKGARYAAFLKRQRDALEAYVAQLKAHGLLPESKPHAVDLLEEALRETGMDDE
jgi:methylenetetrahydrofolate--tRNA-(uracil-5-)-methyltransferase